MRRYFQSKIFRVGFWGLLLGTGPLLTIIFLAAIGLWPDPHPKPVGPGMLAFLTFWPSVIFLVTGITRVKLRKNGDSS